MLALLQLVPALKTPPVVGRAANAAAAVAVVIAPLPVLALTDTAGASPDPTVLVAVAGIGLGLGVPLALSKREADFEAVEEACIIHKGSEVCGPKSFDSTDEMVCVESGGRWVCS